MSPLSGRALYMYATVRFGDIAVEMYNYLRVLCALHFLEVRVTP